MRPRRALPLVLLLVLAGPSGLWACNVPVFRWALEKWRPDDYEVVVLHRGPLAGAEARALTKLQRWGPGEALVANVEVRVVDLAGKVDDEDRALVPEDARLPWVAARARSAEGKIVVAWSGPLTLDSSDFLVASPARQEVSRRLLAGETAVWLLLESGDKKKDDAAARRLDEELARLEPVLKMPPQDEPSAVKGVPLKIDFSVLRVSRSDPSEQALAGMLLTSEDDLAGLAEPMAFPVFGRGRVLEGLVGAGINRETIADACNMLVAACSCELKRQHPGFELLMAVDWNDALQTAGTDPRTPDIQAGETVPLSLPTEVVADQPEEETAPPNAWLLAGVIAALVLVVVTGAWALLSSRR